jgi:NTE family protein
MINNSYALVLGGGGAKGSYQVGAWKALKELGIKFHAIIGTSVGALNGAIIAEDDIANAVKLWETLTIDKIISIPKEFFKDGKFNLSPDNLKYIKDFQKTLFENNGLDTSPLKEILTMYVNEDKIRRSGIDFGIVTYEFKNLKPCEIFLDDMKKGELDDYLLASSTFPGFKITSIDGKKFIDGGVHDNVPVSLAKERGYKRMIVIDVSGIGVNRKPDIYNTETIYIKNSSDTGGILDFNPENAKKNIVMGYLDTMKIFGRFGGLEYHYDNDDKIIRSLERILCSKDFIDECRKQFDGQIVNFDADSISIVIRSILPENFKNYRSLILPLIECAALSLKFDRTKLYSFEDLIFKLDEKYNSFKKPVTSTLNLVLNKIKNPLGMFRISHEEYENILGILLHSLKDFKLYSKTILNIFPYFLPAKLAFILLDKYFKKG